MALARSDSKVLAPGVKGDVAVMADGTRAALSLGQSEDGESAVALVDAAGQVTVIADSEGVDDRPTVSPDNKTVVFISGRAGFASFYRTTTDGAAPVQLTNVNLVVPEGAQEQLESDPVGFVPPPVHAERVWWVDADTLRYDAGDGEFWQLNIRTGVAGREVN